jgi:NAD(P)-dependent dehydrogenase (short-subunit alcohol dehydrogenase family)
MTNDPRGLTVLVTDGMSALGKALVHGLADAGAAVVWAGHRVGSEPGGTGPVIEPFPLDLTSDESVAQAAAAIGSQLDMVINTTDVTGSAHEQMEAHYFGFLRLSRALGPRMCARGASAWVNMLSLYGLSSLPAHEAFCASVAAAHSLSLSLRAEWSSAGLRVVNVFPGPTDNERFRDSTLPKLTAKGLALAVVKALQTGVEDVYPGDVAQEWYARWREGIHRPGRTST